MQARYYDPVIGRFYSNDPVRSHSVHSFNRYSYANNNPYKYTDPDGQLSIRKIKPITPPPPPVIPPVTGRPPGLPTVPETGTPPITLPDIDIPDLADVFVFVIGIVQNAVESEEVDKNKPPNHPDFKSDKKRKDREKIPWNKNKKGYKDRKGNYWEPVPDGHKGTHDPHWDVQHPNGHHTPVYPPKS